MSEYLLLGYGNANRAVARHFEKAGIAYTVYDDYINEYRDDIDYNSFSKIIKSPGINQDHIIVKYSRRLGKEILSDLELFYRFTSKDKTFITVTGTNGKTTTSALIAHLLSDVDLGGNIGAPLFDFIDSPRAIVIEASSYMLEDCSRFRSRICLFLNISPHHLSRHGDFKSYFEAKMKMIQNRTPGDTIIYNYDDIVLRKALAYLPGAVPFSLYKREHGFYCERGCLCYNGVSVLDRENLPLSGDHNVANALAALAAFYAVRKDFVGITERIGKFSSHPYRIEYVGSASGIKYYNDSKATNYTALASALKTFSKEEVLLICGGEKEEADIGVLDEGVSVLKMVFVNGENKEILKKYFSGKHIPVKVFSELKDVLAAFPQKLIGISVVLFSPGAASFDQFSDYKERGEYFNNWFRENNLRQ